MTEYSFNVVQKKRSELAPLVQDLKSLRQRSQELEATYLEKKKAYDATMSGIEGYGFERIFENHLIKGQCKVAPGSHTNA